MPPTVVQSNASHAFKVNSGDVVHDQSVQPALRHWTEEAFGGDNMTIIGVHQLLRKGAGGEEDGLAVDIEFEQLLV